MTDRDSYVILNLLPGIGPVRVKQLLQYYDSPKSILRERGSTLAKVKGIGSKIGDTIANWENHIDLQKELLIAEKAGVDICTLIDPDYPRLLKEIYDPPLCLYVRGNLNSLNQGLLIAIVGSRRTSRYGIDITERLALGAIKAGMTVISGLARGIDTVAHKTAVEHNGTTIAVLGTGLGHIYPQENISLGRKISEKGALISEFPMATKPDRRWFPMRNRIIAGMTKGTLVTEAGQHSGALITAQQAVDHGRQVFAVPGRVDSPLSRGCHYLIKDGAKLVETVDDIFEEFNILPLNENISAEVHGDTGPTTDETFLQLTDNERIVTQLLKEGDLSVNEITQQSQIPIQNLLSILLGLEIKRLIVQLPGKRFSLNQRRKGI